MMRSHHAARAFYAIASLMVLSAAAAARPVKARFFLDGALGASIPIADSIYTSEVWPTVKASLRLGAELWLSRHFGLAPELALDGAPIISRFDDGVHDGKGRFQAGLRVLAGFGNGHAFFARALVGVEVTRQPPAFTAELGVGMQFRVARRAVAGFTAGFPISVYQFETGDAPITTRHVDFDLLGFIGYRR